MKTIVASEKNKGKIYSECTNWLIEGDIPNYARKLRVKSFDIDLFKKNNIKIFFSALPSSVAKIEEKKLLENRFIVFSNSSFYRYNHNVPILIPEVNPDHINLIKYQKKGKIITNANCSTTGLAIALKPLQKFGIKNVFTTTYQAISGAGYPGIPSLEVNSNVIPYIPGEEKKIETETNKILGTLEKDRVCNSNINIISSCARVPVRDGHLESVILEFNKENSLLEIKNAFINFQGINGLYLSPKYPIIFRDEKNRPQPLRDAYAGYPVNSQGMSISVGGLKKQKKWIRFWLVVHNTIRGAAGNSILNAEYAINKYFLKDLI